ncbi:MAG: hypothetical protein JSR48_13645 [Verrucomicrobia bacterium]|nr:hypothetical protein [Verrucomicrobiota bacterium]
MKTPFRLLALLATAAPWTAHGLSASTGSAAPRPFQLEALVDFPDDVVAAPRPITAADIDTMMARLVSLGVKRVTWAYYADARGGYLNPAGYTETNPYQSAFRSEWSNYGSTYRQLGNPLKVAVEAGHRHGLEVYAYYKPYETGPGMIFPTGTAEAAQWGWLDCLGGRLAWIDPFVRDHPELRIKRRTDDLPAWTQTATVRSIRLAKHDDAPTRLTAGHLQVWTSPNNHQYQRKDVKFTVTETVEPAPREVRDQQGKVLTKAGAPVRVLTLSGLALDDRFILVTTDFTGGKPDFVNSGLALMTMLDGEGREIPGTFASGGVIWGANLVDFRTKGLVFDYGWGAAPVVLDAPNDREHASVGADLPMAAADANGRQGFIAFTRGRNAYLPAALCETEPAVREFWLHNVDDILATGVDGIDLRDEGHSTHTDHPEDYGYNDVVLRQAQARPGDLRANIAAVRGDAYTAFVRACRERVKHAGKVLRYNLQIDFYRPDPPASRRLAYPANLDFQWRRWIDEGLIDGAVLRCFALPFSALWDDPVAVGMIAHCRDHGLPVVVNRYVTVPGEKLPDELRRVRADARFAGFVFYETGDYLKFGPRSGECTISYPPVEAAAHAP